MPSFGDSAFIFVLALILFGPKRLPELARQLGKLMAEFRRASNEFRMQMDEELRLADQAEQQKKIAAMEAAAPPPALPVDTTAQSVADAPDAPPTPAIAEEAPTTPLPIATEGELSIMPPSTGLPTPRASASPSDISSTPSSSETAALTPVLESIPHTPDPDAFVPSSATISTNGNHSADSTAPAEAPHHG